MLKSESFFRGFEGVRGRGSIRNHNFDFLGDGNLPMTITAERSQLVFRKLERSLEKLSVRQNEKPVHSFRTSSRRLQTLLEELVSEPTRGQKKLLKLMRGIRKRAGKLRDLDVQITTLRGLEVQLELRRKTQLLQGLMEARASHEKKLRRTLTVKVLREAGKRLKQAWRDTKMKTVRDPLNRAREILARTAPLAKPLTEEELHRCRLLVKRARYAAELAPESPAASQFIAQVKRLQDVLGNWHDWQALTNTAVHRLGDINASPLVAVLHNVTGGKFRHAVAAIAASPILQAGPKPVAMSQKASRTGIKSAKRAAA